MDLWTPEREQWNKGHSIICGVDEAGAGPVPCTPPPSSCLGKSRFPA